MPGAAAAVAGVAVVGAEDSVAGAALAWEEAGIAAAECRGRPVRTAARHPLAVQQLVRPAACRGRREVAPDRAVSAPVVQDRVGSAPGADSRRDRRQD